MPLLLPDLFEVIRNLLVPFLRTKEDRVALLTPTLSDLPIIDHIQWDWSAPACAADLIERASVDELVAVLKQGLRPQVGVDTQEQIDELCAQLRVAQPRIHEKELTVDHIQTLKPDNLQTIEHLEKPCPIILYFDQDREHWEHLRGLLQNTEIHWGSFEEPFQQNNFFRSSRKTAIVLLSNKAIENIEFLNRWGELTRCGYEQFVIIIDKVKLYELPPVFKGLTYYEATPGIFEEIVQAMELGKKISDEFPKSVFEMQAIVSKHETYTTSVFDLQVLRRAWVKISKYAESQDAYYDEVAYNRFEEHLDSNLLALANYIDDSNGNYELQPLIRISIEKSKTNLSDRRQLYQAQPETAVILQAVCDLIGPELESDFIEHSYGNRLVIGAKSDIFRDYWDLYQAYQHDVLEFANKHKNEKYFYHRVDVKQYYPRIDLNQLYSRLKNRIDQPLILNLIEQFFNIDVWTEDNPDSKSEESGLPAGLPISHLLANFHLHQIDLEMKTQTRVDEQTYGYFRYVDDIVFFGKSQDDAEKNRSILERELRACLNLPEDVRSPLNLEKSTSVSQPADETSELQSNLQGISWHIQKSYYPWLSDSEQAEVANTIYNQLFEVEDDPRLTDELAKYTTTGIQRLQELNYSSSEIEKLIYELLKKISLRINNINYLASVLLAMFWHESSAVFRDYVSQSISVVKLAIIQQIRRYPIEQVDLKLLQLIYTFLNDENALVAREVAITLKQFLEIEPSLVPKLEESLVAIYREKPLLVQVYLLELGLLSMPQHFVGELDRLITESCLSMNTVLHILMEYPEFVRYVKIENAEPFLNSENIVRLLNILFSLQLADQVE